MECCRQKRLELRISAWAAALQLAHEALEQYVALRGAARSPFLAFLAGFFLALFSAGLSFFPDALVSFTAGLFLFTPLVLPPLGAFTGDLRMHSTAVSMTVHSMSAQMQITWAEMEDPEHVRSAFAGL